MANHESAKKRVRQDIQKRIRNRYYKKSTRTAIRNLRTMTDKVEASKFFPSVCSMIDKLVKRNAWHANKAANVKSKLARHIATL